MAAPFKMFVAAGGLLIVVSALLFSYNMIRTLFAEARVGDRAEAPMTRKIRQRVKANTATAMLVALTVLGMGVMTVPAMEKMTGKQFAKKVVILSGTYQESSGKAFLREESPGSYADRLLLKPMGAENVGGKLYAHDKNPSKGHVFVRKLDGLTKAAPDAIVMTGDAIAVQKALTQAIHKNPDLGNVPAIKAHAIYSLSGYIDSSVIERPLVLQRWADVLGQ